MVPLTGACAKADAAQTLPSVPAPPSPPALARQLLLLWELRVRLAAGGLRLRGSALASVAGLTLLVVLSLAAAQAGHALFDAAPVREDARLRLFLLLLAGFEASTLWIIWPAVTAGVDDAAELSRFSLFPIAPRRVFLASVVAGMFEPRALPLWGLMAGACAAVATDAASALVAAAASVALALCSVTWGRAGLHALLNLLRQRRSAEAMGAGLLGLLFLTTLVPPPDLSWLSSVAAGTPRIDSRLVDGATAFFALLPTGGWGCALRAAEAGAPMLGLAFVGWILAGTLPGWILALRLLERFHRGAGRALPQTTAPRPTPDAFRGRTTFSVLVERELREMLANPRARLMAAMPFFLAILVQLAGGRALAEALLGDAADAWVLGGIAAYAALLPAGGFGQNIFGYDGAGARLLLGAPVPGHLVVRAKNTVHAGAAVLLCALVSVFYSLRVGTPSPALAALVLLLAVWQALLLVAAGNVLSVVAPRKFHAHLRRRDRAPALATAANLLAVTVAVAPGVWAARHFGAHPPPAALAGAAVLVLAGLAARTLGERAALRLLERRRPAFFAALALE